MVSFEKCANVIARPLIGLVNFDSRFFYFQGIQHKCDSIEELRMFSLVCHKLVKLFLVWGGNNIPSLDSSYVTIIYGVEPEVFNMPTEWRKEHSHINPGHRDATDEFLFLVSDSQNRLGTLVNIIEVEKTFFIIEILIFGSLCIKSGKAASVLGSR